VGRWVYIDPPRELPHKRPLGRWDKNNHPRAFLKKARGKRDYSDLPKEFPHKRPMGRWHKSDIPRAFLIKARGKMGLGGKFQ